MWIEKHIVRPYLAFDSVLCEALQHNLPPMVPPPHHPSTSYPLPRVIFRMFDYTDCPEVMREHFSSLCIGETNYCIIGGYVTLFKHITLNCSLSFIFHFLHPLMIFLLNNFQNYIAEIMWVLHKIILFNFRVPFCPDNIRSRDTSSKNNWHTFWERLPLRGKKGNSKHYLSINLWP